MSGPFKATATQPRTLFATFEQLTVNRSHNKGTLTAEKLEGGNTELQCAKHHFWRPWKNGGVIGQDQKQNLRDVFHTAVCEELDKHLTRLLKAEPDSQKAEKLVQKFTALKASFKNLINKTDSGRSLKRENMRKIILKVNDYSKIKSMEDFLGMTGSQLVKPTQKIVFGKPEQLTKGQRNDFKKECDKAIEKTFSAGHLYFRGTGSSKTPVKADDALKAGLKLLEKLLPGVKALGTLVNERQGHFAADAESTIGNLKNTLLDPIGRKRFGCELTDVEVASLLSQIEDQGYNDKINALNATLFGDLDARLETLNAKLSAIPALKDFTLATWELPAAGDSPARGGLKLTRNPQIDTNAILSDLKSFLKTYVENPDKAANDSGLNAIHSKNDMKALLKEFEKTALETALTPRSYRERVKAAFDEMRNQLTANKFFQSLPEGNPDDDLDGEIPQKTRNAYLNKLDEIEEMFKNGMVNIFLRENEDEAEKLQTLFDVPYDLDNGVRPEKADEFKLLDAKFERIENAHDTLGNSIQRNGVDALFMGMRGVQRRLQEFLFGLEEDLSGELPGFAKEPVKLDEILACETGMMVSLEGKITLNMKQAIEARESERNKVKMAQEAREEKKENIETEIFKLTRKLDDLAKRLAANEDEDELENLRKEGRKLLSENMGLRNFIQEKFRKSPYCVIQKYKKDLRELENAAVRDENEIHKFKKAYRKVITKNKALLDSANKLLAKLPTSKDLVARLDLGEETAGKIDRSFDFDSVETQIEELKANLAEASAEQKPELLKACRKLYRRCLAEQPRLEKIKEAAAKKRAMCEEMIDLAKSNKSKAVKLEDIAFYDKQIRDAEAGKAKAEESIRNADEKLTYIPDKDTLLDLFEMPEEELKGLED